MRALFSPAIAAMNRFSYNSKFMLLALFAVCAVGLMAFNFFVSIDKEISTVQRELDGLVLSAPIFHAVQLAQRHRALDTALIKGAESMRGERDAIKKAVGDALGALEAQLPDSLKAATGWEDTRRDWALLLNDKHNWTAQENFAAHTGVIARMLLLQTTIADEYRLIFDSEAGSYYLIDIIVNDLPHVIEHLGQLRAQGLASLIDRRVTDAQRIRTGAVISELGDALANLEANIGKAARHNPALQESLQTAAAEIRDSVAQIVGLMESDILNGRFSMTPDQYYAMSSAAIDKSYSHFHESLLAAAGALLKERLAGAKNTLHLTIGVAALLLLVVAYFTAGIYYSIIGSVRSLARSAHAFSEGDMSARVRLDARDELGEIGDSFNRMADGFSAMIEARRHAEEAMHKSEMKFRAIYESSSDGIMLLDENGFIDCNDATLRVFGCTAREDFLGRHPAQFSPPVQPGGQDSASLANEHIATAFENGSHWFEYMHCRLDGAEFSAGVLLTSMEMNGKRVLQSTVRDITQRKKAEESLRKSYEELAAINRQLEEAQNQLLQSEKMASIGQLAAGVAHEINNPIGYVYSNLGTLEKYMQEAIATIEMYECAELMTDDVARGKPKTARERLDLAFLKEDLRALMSESRDGITRVKKIVQSLKDFSHVDASNEWHLADLHHGLDSTLNIVHNEIKYKAKVVKAYGELPEIECLPSQLNQVFMNLLVNATHAIEERGTITIRTGRQGEEVWVEVSDTGKGIAPEHLRKIFDPFFTTKPVGKGTGLGLSLSYGIVQKHRGRIEVQSEPGKGTTFRITLPVRQDSAG